MLVLAGAILLALRVLHPCEGFVPSPRSRPTHSSFSAGAGFLASLGTVLGPADSLASEASREAVRKAAKGLAEKAPEAKAAASAASAAAVKAPAAKAAASAASAADPDLFAPILKVLANAPELAFKALFQQNLYAFGLPFLSWNLVWVLVAVGIPGGIFALGIAATFVMAPPTEYGKAGAKAGSK